MPATKTIHKETLCWNASTNTIISKRANKSPLMKASSKDDIWNRKHRNLSSEKNFSKLRKGKLSSRNDRLNCLRKQQSS